MRNSREEILNFTLLYNEYKKGVYNYVLRMVGDVMVTEDIVQNVFLKLFENLSRIRKRESVRYWIFTTTRNEIYSLFRKRKVHADKYNTNDSAIPETEADGNLSFEYEMEEFKVLVMRVIESLPPEQKEVYLLKEYGGLSYREIAETIGIDINLVKSRLYKTRQKLIRKIMPLIKQE